MNPPTAQNGCSYGRSNRWLIGILLLICLGVVSAAVGYTMSTRDEMQANRQSIGRLDERLVAIQESLRRIERTIQEENR